MSRARRILLLLVFAFQLAAPGLMIRDAERTLHDGQVFRFETRPVDPVDLFRGRYVALDFHAESGPGGEEDDFETGRQAYARIVEGPDGFAVVAEVQLAEPEDPNFLIVVVSDVSPEAVSFHFPLDRFYMEERIAPAAERAYAQRGAGRTWARVRVRNGHGLIEDVLIDGVPLRKAAKEPRATTQP